MKILSIAGRNLNSLRVEFKVDFSTGALKNCGIFAITGPMGAGKTTLLDAITLALYGRTPRVTKDEDIISYGASEARAEVVFKTAEGIFKSEWKVRRARSKHDGALQQSTMELSTYPEGIILSQKKREAQEKVRDLLRLEYSQFLKSVLLAQGAFKAFLDASDGERGEMLEKISDTSLYTKLSKRAFERKKTEELALDQLRAKAGNIILLNEEEQLEHLNAIMLLKEEGKELQEDLNLLQIKANWLQTIRELTTKKLQADKEAELAKLRLEQERPSLLRWEAHLQVETLELQWMQYQGKNDELQVQQEQIRKLGEKIVSFSGALQNALDFRDRAQKELELAVWNRQEKMPGVLGAITRLADLQAEKKQLGMFSEQLRLKIQEESDCESKLQQQEAALTKDQQILKDLNSWINEHQKYAEAGNSFTEASLIVNQLKRSREEVDALESTLSKTREQIQEAGKKLASTNEKHLEAEKEEHKLIEQEVATAGQLTELKGRLNSYSNQHLLLLEKTGELIALQQNELSRQQFLAEHLSILHEGEACPLCGSTDHPNQTLSIPDVHKEINRLEAELSEHQTAYNSKRLRQATISRLMVSLDEYPDPIEPPGKQLPDNFEKIIPELVRLHKSLPAKLHEASITQARARQLKESLAENIQDLESRKAVALQNLEAVRETIALQVASLEKIAAEYNVEPGSFNLQKLPETLSGYWQEYNTRFTRESVLKATVPGILAGIENLKVQIAGIEEDIHQLQQNIEDKNRIIKQFSEEIAAAHAGYPSPEAARNALNAEEQRASEKLRQAGELYNRLSQENEKVLGEKELAERNLNELRLKIGALSNFLKAALAELGLPGDIHLIERQLVTGNERISLGNLYKSLHHKLVLAEAQSQTCKDQLELQQSLAITNEEEEFIAANMKQVQENLKDSYNRIGQREQILKENETKQEKIRFIKNDIEAQEKVLQKWAGLSSLIGSDNGKKFNLFAQGLTLDRLIIISNHHLQLLNDRYLLKRNTLEQSLGLRIIDQYQAGNEREINTLSGGESFLVSLALALGLSEMTSKLTTIDSLFIDEGFGTLDAETLEVALTALRGLKISGKTIGIISHVERLKEEIYTQVEITKGSDGFSTLKVLPEL